MPKTKLPVGMPRQELPYPKVMADYGMMALKIMEERYISSCKAEIAKGMEPHQFNWTLEWQRCEDPDCHDPEAFLSYLVANSKFFLVARGGKWVGSEELGSPPPQILSRLKEHARLTCNQRAKEPEKLPDDGTDLEPVSDSYPQSPIWCLGKWLDEHPSAHPGLARLARAVVQELIQSVER